MILLLTTLTATACISPESPVGVANHQTFTVAANPVPDQGADPVPVEEPVPEAVAVPVTVEITLDEPAGWTPVDVIIFDGSGENVSDWMDRVGYPEASTAPTVLAVTAEYAGVWGWRGWSGVRDTMIADDRLLAPASLADFVAGIEASTPENIAGSAAAIALTGPVYTALIAEISDGTVVQLPGEWRPGSVVGVQVPAGQQLLAAIDGDYGSIIWH